MFTLYETPAGESVYLFIDFNEGKLYVNRPNSTCYVEYENPDSKRNAIE
ncbi:hypothetical protein RRG08_057590, partial [Elysia crispata]